MTVRADGFTVKDDFVPVAAQREVGRVACFVVLARDVVPLDHSYIGYATIIASPTLVPERRFLPLGPHRAHPDRPL